MTPAGSTARARLIAFRQGAVPPARPAARAVAVVVAAGEPDPIRGTWPAVDGRPTARVTLEAHGEPRGLAVGTAAVGDAVRHPTGSRVRDLPVRVDTLR